MAAVEVSTTAVIAPPERFLHIADDALLEHFQDACDTDEEAVSLGGLYAMIDGLTQASAALQGRARARATVARSCAHDFSLLRKRLERNFAAFSSGGGGAFSGHRTLARRADRSLKRQASLQEMEEASAAPPAPAASPPPCSPLGLLPASARLRFLKDFFRLTEAAHYRLLSEDEWELASAEEFLFSLPVTVDWGALDRELLTRFWAGRPKQRQARARGLPRLADRILIFHRGITRARMSGLYLGLKIELLVSFLLLRPLWRAATAAARAAGLRPPAQAPLPHGGGAAAAALKRAAAGAMAAARLRSGPVLKRSNTSSGGRWVVWMWEHVGAGTMCDYARMSVGGHHHAPVIVERRTLNRAFPNAAAVLRQLLSRVELQEACYRDVVVPPSVFVQLAAAVVLAVVGVAATLMEAGLSWKVWGSALLLLGSRAIGLYFQTQSERAEIEREMNRLLLERLGASQEAVLNTLTGEVCRQRIRELLVRCGGRVHWDSVAAWVWGAVGRGEGAGKVCYCVLRGAGAPLSDAELHAACERTLRRSFGLAVEFSTEAAVPQLVDWGLIARDAEGALVAAPLEEAVQLLDDVWDSTFQFNNNNPIPAEEMKNKSSWNLQGEAEAAESAESAESAGALPPPASPAAPPAAAPAQGARHKPPPHTSLWELTQPSMILPSMVLPSMALPSVVPLARGPMPPPSPFEGGFGGAAGAAPRPAPLPMPRAGPSAVLRSRRSTLRKIPLVDPEEGDP
eukprot:scaffold3.g6555.t1